jgi:ABC-type multidrug transport system ATPase subunit
MALVGASGCGKTTLLKTIAGLVPETSGEIRWNDRNLSTEGDLLPNEFAYVPQFSIAFDPLTVEESVESAARLRVRASSRAEEDEIIEKAIEVVGLTPIRDRRVKVLSGGQKRRLGLAMELVARPSLLLCDEVTSGLDPKTEQEIVHLLHALSRRENRLVINVTHSLTNIDMHDSILVMHAGHLVFHGPPRLLPHYFSVQHPEEVYRRLADREPLQWHNSWQKHRAFYYERMKLAAPSAGHDRPEHATTPLEAMVRPNGAADDSASKDISGRDVAPKEPKDAEAAKDADSAPRVEKPEDAAKEAPKEAEARSTATRSTADVPETPGIIRQTAHLFARRWKIFFRDRTQLVLHIAILIGFPILVMLFTLTPPDGLKRESGTATNALVEMQEKIGVEESKLIVGGFASGVIMFQVILLTLMGSNNSAREIAGERMIYEKEKLAGLRPAAYLTSKLLFLAVPVTAQAVWMGVFVELFGRWQFPGAFTDHLVSLWMVTAAMTAVCLGISANMRSADQANLLSIYLVGFQLPLSGIVLALPGFIEPLVRPFISAYWSWSGSVQMLNAGTLNAVERVSATSLQSYQLCLFVLAIHLAIGLFASYVGARKNLWEGG